MNSLYNNSFVNMDNEITEQDISEVEYEFGFTFPSEIRTHYLTYNGGEPERYVFVSHDGSEYIVTQFLPIKYAEEAGRNIEYVMETLRNGEILPNWLIPFADEPGGDLYCFSLRDSELGAVYYWSHEYDLGEDQEEHINYLAESIGKFINGMVEDK